MNSLNFKALVMVFILAAGFLVTSPFTSDLIADPYTLIVNLVVEECWDTSTDPGSLPTLCDSDIVSSTTAMAPSDHIGGHLPNHISVNIKTIEKTTSSCYIGCSSS